MNKTLVISDLHLTKHFNKKKFEFLKELIGTVDKVVINGDFWSYYSTTFNGFVNSRWKGLFKLLKEKDTTYVFGNHDQKIWCNDKVNLFSTKQVEEEEIKIGKFTYKITHGHKLVKKNYIDSDLYTKIFRLFYLDAFRYSLETILIKIFGLSLYSAAKRINLNYKEIASQLPNNHILVTGHSHYLEIDLANKYINSGFIHSGYATYVVLEEDGPKQYIQKF